MGVEEGISLLPDHLPDAGGTVGKTVRLTRKTRPSAISHFTPDPSLRILGIQRRADATYCVPLPPKERGVRWASLAIFVLALELGDYLHLGTRGTCSRREEP